MCHDRAIRSISFVAKRKNSSVDAYTCTLREIEKLRAKRKRKRRGDKRKSKTSLDMDKLLR